MRAHSSDTGTSHAKKWGILHIINLGTLMATLDVGIINVSLPTMAREFSISLAQIQWVATAYLLTMVTLLPFLGKLSDIWDRRKIYSYGFLLFSIGSLCTALSQGLISILVSRCLQGIGATMIMANSQAMLRQVFPNHERGRALGINAVVISTGTLAGPAIGGLLLEFVNWTWLFAINVPIGLAAFLLGLRWFPRAKINNARTSFDIVGSFLLAGGTSVLIFATETNAKGGGFTPAMPFVGGVGIALLVALWLYERRITYGILDHELLRQPKIVLGNAGSFFINVSQTATMIPITFYLQGRLGFAPWVTGLLLILQPLLMGVVAPFAGWFRDRYGGFFPITIGPLFCAASMLFVACAHHVSALDISLQLALFGVGIGLFQTTNNAEIMSAAPDAKISLASSLLAMIRYLGQIAGIGLATLLVGSMGAQNRANATINIQLQILFWICLLGCSVVTVLGLLRPRDKPQFNKITESD
ncbi:riboflavin transporter RibZ [Dictyobacter sp. S3.2.2.5]|uniref:Riboflavin transporter RibZ n=1 Tax=Dictyobacter halimunensis TaxID=3026934 RepID=A0ABQ6FIP7_9CHLR|nr:riboflavin transporter RibZ [Dictyobacter sp. S3.2.2.5]